MKGLSRSQGSGAWRFRLMYCAAAIAVTVCFLLLTSDLPPQVRALTSTVGLLAGGLALALSCGHRALNSVGRRRRAWGCLSAAGLLGFLGNLWPPLLQVTGAPAALMPLQEIAFFLALLLSMAALVVFPSIARRGTELWRLVLDGVVIGGSMLVIASLTVFPEILRANVGTPGAGVIQLVLPLLDVVLATLAALLVIRSSRDDRPALALVGVGFSVYAISDTAFLVLTARREFEFGTPIDLGWIAGYALIALAARHRAASTIHHSDMPKEGSPLIGTVVMFGVFLTAAMTRAFRIDNNSNVGAAATTIWMVVLLAVATRQILLIMDNERLRRDLERRVDERTADLRRVTRRAELLLTSVADGIYGVDRSGRISFVNPVAAKTLGYASEDLIGRDARDTFHAEHEDSTTGPRSSCYITDAIERGVITNAEEDVYARADGGLVPVEVTASPLNSDHLIEGAVVAFRDVTQRREVDRMKSEFLSIVSHELRTPLTSIRGSLGLLAAGALGDLPPSAARMIDIAVDSSERLTRLINDILDIERMESGGLPLDIGDHAARTLVESAIDQVQVLASQASVAVTVGTVGGRVHADADRVVQTLINLLGNAIKFSAAGSSVTVSAAPRGATVQFDVVDSGRGIPAEKLDSVFARFEQVDSSDAREKGGTGLGLAISRSLVERLGGKIWAENNAGGGSTFSFTLPSASDVMERDRADQGPLVLVCDDDDHAVEVLSQILRHKGYRPVGVTDGIAAIEIAQREKPAAVLLDLLMPGTSGAEVVHALKSRPETRDIPVVIVSGLHPARDPMLASQIDGWLVKPVPENRLADAVTAAISNNPSWGSVLLVEDDDDLAKVIKTLFERRGLTVYWAATKAEALSHCDRVSPHVLVLDLQLPDADGTELIAALKVRSDLAHIPVVVYSALDVNGADRDDLRLGKTLFLTKGRASPQQLEDRVLELLDVTTGRYVPATGRETVTAPI